MPHSFLDHSYTKLVNCLFKIQTWKCLVFYLPTVSRGADSTAKGEKVVNFRTATRTVMFTESQGLRFWVKGRFEGERCEVNGPW